MPLLDALYPAFAARPVARPNGKAHAPANPGWLPPVDVLDREEEYVLRLDVPGVGDQEVKVEYREGVLAVFGRRGVEGEQGRYTRRERKTGEFRREFRLPEAIAAEGIVARHDRGVLEIRIPKAERARRIPIQ